MKGMIFIGNTNRRRKHRVEIRLSESEYSTLCRNIKNCGENTNAYLRDLIMNVRPMQLPPMEYGEILKELRSLGVNMNQLAVKAHSLGFVDERRYRENAAGVWNVCGELAAQLVRREAIDNGSH